MTDDDERCPTCGAYPEDFHEFDCPAAFVPGDDEPADNTSTGTDQEGSL